MRDEKVRMGRRPQFGASHFLIASSAVRAGSQFLLVIILAQMLGPRAVGVFSLALAIAAPIFLFAGWGLRQIILTFTEHVAFRTYVRARVGLSIGAVLVCLGVGFAAGDQHTIMILAVAAIKSCDLFVDWASAFFQRANQNQRLFYITAMNGTVTAVAVACAAGITRDASASVAFGALANCVTTAVTLPFFFRGTLTPADHVPANRMGLLRVLHAGLPLGFAAMATMLVQSVPQYLLAAAHHEEAVGRLAVLLYLTFFAEMILNGQVQAWIPEARALRESRQLDVAHAFDASRRSMAPSVWVGGTAIVCGYFLFPLVLGTFFGFTLWDAVPLLVIALCQPPLFYCAMALTVHNRYRAQLYSSLVGVALVGVISLALVPMFGVLGALWAYAGAVVARTAAVLLQLHITDQRNPGASSSTDNGGPNA